MSVSRPQSLPSRRAFPGCPLNLGAPGDDAIVQTDANGRTDASCSLLARDADAVGECDRRTVFPARALLSAASIYAVHARTQRRYLSRPTVTGYAAQYITKSRHANYMNILTITGHFMSDRRSLQRLIIIDDRHRRFNYSQEAHITNTEKATKSLKLIKLLENYIRNREVDGNPVGECLCCYAGTHARTD